jgi:hypothetical protein
VTRDRRNCITKSRRQNREGKNREVETHEILNRRVLKPLQIINWRQVSKIFFSILLNSLKDGDV